ncbi:MAG: asparaginase, partial [Gemmatimonadota bacterium]
AWSYARLASAAAAGESAPAAVVSAMTGHPELTSSPGREPLRIMRAGAGRLLAKEGAEGVLCVAAVDRDWGLALKVVDGGRRAVGPAAVAVLVRAGLLAEDERLALSRLATVPIEGTTGERVGEFRGVVDGAGGEVR